jgi:FKBP-type peptidyl-prolyl cis-trans isomerase (trigger factor)
MSRVTEAENIEVTEEEIENGINNMVRSTPEERREEMRKLLDTPQTRQNLQQSVKTRKTIERLTDIAKSAGIAENKDKGENKETTEEKPKKEKKNE